MRPHAKRVLVALGILLGIAAVIALGRGAVEISPGEVVAAIADKLGFDLGDTDERRTAIVWSVRMPRVVLAILVGAALACSGAALQGVVRNALADPTLVGVSGGAALGAVTAIVLGGQLLAHSSFGVWLVPAAAFGGALLSTRAALALARVGGATSGVTVLLAGIGLAALAGSGVGILLYLADDAALRSVTFWNLGSVGGATWSLVGAIAIPILVAVLWLPRLAGELDRLALGDREARHVGVDVDRLTRRVTTLASLAVGAAVAACGSIAFVGLVVPYLARAALGPGHRSLLPACALGGALLLVIADLVARTIVAPAEIPIGVITALAGAPVLLALVRRGRGGTAMP